MFRDVIADFYCCLLFGSAWLPKCDWLSVEMWLR
jgi:hypothetical protein